MKQEQTITLFGITKTQKQALDKFTNILKEKNKLTNLVGGSTLINPWRSHILDSLQILSFIKNKEQSILDMGTGAGLPGIILSILGYKKITLVDSNGKKIKFLNQIKETMGLNVDIILNRLENLNNIKFDIITSRALAKLDKLIFYSQKFLKKNTVLIFLKGKTVNDELKEASKKWKFQYEKHQSLSDPRGCVLILKKIQKND